MGSVEARIYHPTGNPGKYSNRINMSVLNDERLMSRRSLRCSSLPFPEFLVVSPSGQSIHVCPPRRFLCLRHWLSSFRKFCDLCLAYFTGSCEAHNSYLDTHPALRLCVEDGHGDSADGGCGGRGSEPGFWSSTDPGSAPRSSVPCHPGVSLLVHGMRI